MARAPWILPGALIALVQSFLATLAFQRLAKTDGPTAIYSVALGASAEMVMRAQRAGADGASVASAHASRIIMVTSAASLVAAMLGQSFNPLAPSIWVVPALELALLFVLAGVAAWTLQMLRLPEPLIIKAQILIGWALGQNINREFLTARRAFYSARPWSLSVFCRHA